MTLPSYMYSTTRLRTLRDEADDRYRAALVEAERWRVKRDTWAAVVRHRELRDAVVGRMVRVTKRA